MDQRSSLSKGIMKIAKSSPQLTRAHKRQLVSTLLAVFCCVLLFGVLAPADDWPMFRGNPQSTGVSASSLPEALDIVWKFTPGPNSAFESTPAIVNGVVYVADADGRLIALDLKSGAKLWEVATEIGFTASPSVRDGLIFIGDLGGEFYCFDIHGQKKWQFTATAEIDGSANFYKENILFGSQDATLYCLNMQTGKEVWRFNTDDQIRCSPTLIENRAFIAGCDGQLHVVDLDHGTEVGSMEMSQTMVTPAAAGDFVFCGTEQAGFFAYDWRRLQPLWHIDIDSPIQSSPAIAPLRATSPSSSSDRKTGSSMAATQKAARRFGSSPPAAKSMRHR